MLGTIALVLAVAGGVTALPCYLFWARGRTELRGAAHLCTGIMALGVLVASLFQVWNILTHQFQYEYITNFSDRSLPTLLLVSTFWGGQSGSFLLWSTWSVLFALVLVYGLRRSAWEPFVLTPYLLVSICIITITLASRPWKLLPEVPADGNGLNPLLQNYWMAIHPPILFTGFTTMAGPFAFAVAALWRRDYDGWVVLAKPWTLLAWACMGAGLALGGFWAYESLGWGGFWGWDPVENSSLIPWLFASASLHGLLIQGTRGSFKRGNLALAVFGYVMVVYSTFLTRSGLWGNVSVHSFVELGLLNFLLAFMVVFALLGFGMLAWRWRTINRRVLYQHVLSREFGLVVAIALFVIVAVVVGVGTSMPVLTMLPLFSNQIIVDLGWYGPTVAPFGFLLLLTMAVGPLLGWQSRTYGSLAKLLRWPAVLTGVSLFVALLLDVTYPVALLFVGAAVFAVAANAAVIVRIWRSGPLKLGGYLAHIGVGLLFVGIVGTSLYKQTASLQLTEDVPQTVFGRQFTFRGVGVPARDPLRRRAVQIEVTEPRTGQTWIAEAPHYTFMKSGALVSHPAIQSGLWSDLYIAPSQYDPPAQTAPGTLQMVQGRTQRVSGYALTFRHFALPDQEAMLRGTAPAVVEAVIDVVAPDGTTTTVVPQLQVDNRGATTSTPVMLPGGATALLSKVDPAGQMAVVQLGNVDLSDIRPEDMQGRVFVDVSVEPGIKFAWAGFVIGIAGGLLALIRRWCENRRALVVRAAVPQGAPAPRMQPPVHAGGATMIVESEAR